MSAPRRALASLLALTSSLGALALPVSPALAANPASESRHVVAAGETLNGIANRAGVSPEALARANNLQPPYIVRLGQALVIPRETPAAPEPATTPKPRAGTTRSYRVTSGETLNGIANRAGVSPESLAQANGLTAPYVVRVGQTLTIPGEDAPAPARAAPAASSAPEAPLADSSADTYRVQSGETLGGIANRTGVAASLIAEANGLAAPYVVRVGQTLQIPRGRRYTATAKDSGFSIALRYGVPWDQIALANGLDPSARVTPGQSLVIPTVVAGATSSAAPAPAASPAPAAAPARTVTSSTTPFVWPVRGPIARGFATGTDYHDGIDIKAAKGTVVRASAAGTVRFAGLEKEQFGNLVVLDNGNGWFTAYAFLSRISVSKGMKVQQGQRVGLVGDTGQAVGSELHFEIRKDGKPVNPVDELPKGP